MYSCTLSEDGVSLGIVLERKRFCRMCGFDTSGGRLYAISQDPKILVVELPILHIIPIEGNKLKLTNTFRTPVYVTQARRNAMGVGLIFEADLSTTIHPSHWVLQGVALCLNIDH